MLLAYLVYAHECSIIHYPAACRCVQHRLCHARMRTSTAAQAALHAGSLLCAACALRAAQELDSQACQPCSLGKTGQTAVPWDSESLAKCRALWGAGRWELVLPWGDGSAPLAPLPTLVSCNSATAGAKVANLCRCLLGRAGGLKAAVAGRATGQVHKFRVLMLRQTWRTGQHQ